MPDLPATTWILLADDARLRILSESFRSDRTRPETGGLVLVLSILACVVLALWIVSRLAARRDRGHRINHPNALFAELCKAHGLDRQARQLLQSIARQQRLAHPARLFLEPERLNPTSLTGPLAARRSEIEALRRRLFTGLPGID